MLSQTGPFTIPVACLTKKCLISADRVVVDFGRVCVGETVRRKVTLTNSGALPTNFNFESKSQLLQPSSNVSHILSVNGALYRHAKCCILGGVHLNIV